MMRRWWILGIALLAASACGGNVVVDHGGAGGSGNGGSGSGNGAQGGGNACDKAVRFVEGCAMAETSGAGTPTGDCSGITECQSNCILASSCAALTGGDPGGAQQLGQCLAVCSGVP